MSISLLLASNGEARRALKENAISVNKERVGEDYGLTSEDLINDAYIIINKGKKNTYIIKAIYFKINNSIYN